MSATLHNAAFSVQRFERNVGVKAFASKPAGLDKTRVSPPAASASKSQRWGEARSSLTAQRINLNEFSFSRQLALFSGHVPATEFT